MIGFAVYLNGKKLTVAGADDLHVLHTIVNAVGRLGKKTHKNQERGSDLFFSVGGLTGRDNGLDDEHLTWVSHRKLRIGDKVTIRLVRTDHANVPISSKPAGGNMEKITAKRIEESSPKKKGRTARLRKTKAKKPAA